MKSLLGLFCGHLCCVQPSIALVGNVHLPYIEAQDARCVLVPALQVGLAGSRRPGLAFSYDCGTA